jgi:hypothetical protein
MVLWVIRAGNEGQWEQLSIEKGIIALGFSEVPDMTGIDDKESFRELIAKSYKGSERNRTSNFASQLWAFTHSMGQGDLIVMPLKGRREVMVGEAAGPYQYHGITTEGYSHSRPVRWHPRVISLDEFPEDMRPSFLGLKTVGRSKAENAELRVKQLIGQVASARLPKDVALEIVGIAKSIADNGLEKSHLSKGSPENTKYHEIVRPQLQAFQEKHGQGPEKVLEGFLRDCLLRMPQGKKYEALSFNFYGRILNSYVWASIIQRDPSVTNYKASYKPQLFILIGSFGIRFGFCYGNYMKPDDPRINLVRQDGLVAEQLLTILRATKGLNLYSSEDPTRLPSPSELVEVTDSDGLKAAWADASHVAQNYPADAIPENLEERMKEALDALFGFFDVVTSADKKGPPPPSENYLIDDFSKETGYDTAVIEGWQRQLMRKRHLIFQGPPGTGKTFVAQKLARLMTSGTKGFSEIVQFHPAYSYEDFVQGLKPKPAASGIAFEIEPGRFLRFCKRAEEAGEDNPCVLLIDEINRANLPRVFGELLYLLEYRESSVPLAAGGSLFKIPKNVFIVGTMNTADRSIALVDFALRRRFHFVRLRPEYDILERHLVSNGLPASSLVSVLREINENIDDPNYALGISYFMAGAGNLKPSLPDIWKGEIEPYLEEYFYDKPSKLQEYRWEVLLLDRLKDWKV